MKPVTRLISVNPLVDSSARYMVLGESRFEGRTMA
jgi:hypothetical protein